MAVTKYYCNKDQKNYWRVYVQKQSKIYRHIRLQKNIGKIPFEDEQKAYALEEQWKERLASKVAKKEAQGCCWDELIERFELHYKRYPTKKMNTSTMMDHVSRVRNYTAEWLKLPCQEIQFGDACELFEEFLEKGLSKALRTNIKGSINKIYKWGIQRKFIVNISESPTLGVEIEDLYELEEEKEPEILNQSEIALFLKRAFETKHPWADIWKFDLNSGLRAQEINGLRKEDITLINPKQAVELEKTTPRNKINYGTIRVKRQWSTKLKRCTRLKGKYSRTVPLNSEMYWWLIKYLPQAQFGKDKHGSRLFPKTKAFDNGDQAAVIRMFCESQGLKSIKYHTLRACWATEVLRSGVPATDLMLMGGWRDYKTMMIYIRLAGLETVGATEGLNYEVSTQQDKLNMSAAQWSELKSDKPPLAHDKPRPTGKEEEEEKEALPDNVVHLFG